MNEIQLWNHINDLHQRIDDLENGFIVEEDTQEEINMDKELDSLYQKSSDAQKLYKEISGFDWEYEAPPETNRECKHDWEFVSSFPDHLESGETEYILFFKCSKCEEETSGRNDDSMPENDSYHL